MKRVYLQFLRRRNGRQAKELMAFFLWGLLLFKYWATGELYLLIHPSYFPLVFASSIILFLVFITKVYLLLFQPNFASGVLEENKYNSSLLPRGWASNLLIFVAIIGLTVPPMVLNSETVMKRGVNDLPPTTLQPQSFSPQTEPEKRSLIEWIRTLSVYPEPDNYVGQRADISGFVVYGENLPENYIYLSRFVLTCCAADAYPVGMLVELPQPRYKYPPDSWLQVRGVMKVANLPTLSEKTARRQLALQAEEVIRIAAPKNPYQY
ncbi:MAG: TIGR03943 family protein [Geminocystis sp.]|nr:TIGR03943 family protein [Geminocystis sp.]MDW8115474.1 TIGR03943 family protein [Geminocystis sp.]